MTYHKVTEGVGAKGSVVEFDDSWKQFARETAQNYFTRGKVTKQIQLSFKSQWEIYQSFLKKYGLTNGKSLEPGSGRGSISLYFANAGYEATLLDTSQEVLNVAQEIFEANKLAANFVCGNALQMPFATDTFDVIVHVGLLEHFVDYEKCLAEQIRVLKPGGLLLANIVPGKWSVQRLARPGIFLFRIIHKIWSHIFSRNQVQKEKNPLYRTEHGSDVYISVLKKMGCVDIFSSGMFPVPVFSYSPEFPFSPNHPVVERTLVFFMRLFLGIRKFIWPHRHPWLCSEWWGQHVLVVARKSGEAHEEDLVNLS